MDSFISPCKPIKPLSILLVTEYLPPFISGIANRCRNLIAGYRKQGHLVTVVSCAGSDCDIAVPSFPNPFYAQQRFCFDLKDH